MKENLINMAMSVTKEDLEQWELEEHIEKETLLKKTCMKYETTPQEVRMGGRKAEQVKKRWKVVRELWATGDFTLSSLARLLYKDHSTIINVLNNGEKYVD